MRILPEVHRPVNKPPLQRVALRVTDPKILSLDDHAVRAIGLGAYTSARLMLDPKGVPVDPTSKIDSALALAYGRSIILRGWLAWQQ